MYFQIFLNVGAQLIVAFWLELLSVRKRIDTLLLMEAKDGCSGRVCHGEKQMERLEVLFSLRKLSLNASARRKRCEHHKNNFELYRQGCNQRVKKKVLASHARSMTNWAAR